MVPIWIASVIHILWAALFVSDIDAGNATPTHALIDVFGPHPVLIAILLTLAAILALFGILHQTKLGFSVLILIPQQILLGISAAGSAIAMWNSRFADGVLRPTEFIIADQISVMAIWIGHSIILMALLLVWKVNRDHKHDA